MERPGRVSGGVDAEGRDCGRGAARSPWQAATRVDRRPAPSEDARPLRRQGGERATRLAGRVDERRIGSRERARPFARAVPDRHVWRLRGPGRRPKLRREAYDGSGLCWTPLLRPLGRRGPREARGAFSRELRSRRRPLPALPPRPRGAELARSPSPSRRGRSQARLELACAPRRRHRLLAERCLRGRRLDLGRHGAGAAPRPRCARGVRAVQPPVAEKCW
jgi:hypothetical protein